MRFVATTGGHTERVSVSGDDGRYRVGIGEEVHDVDARRIGGGLYSILMAGAAHLVVVTEEDGLFVVEVGGERYEIGVEEETRYVIRTRGGTATDPRGQVLRAPMPGKVTQVAVSPGQAVAAGAPLVVIEAMKMENELRAKGGGTVKEVHARPGQAVNAGDVLVVIE